MDVEFETTDLVRLKTNLIILPVAGVIHDDERLFVTGEDGKEFEVSFDDVEERWALKSL